MENRVTAPNPYGKIDLEKLSSFERELGGLLPKEYRDYLVCCNGGKYEKDVVRIGEKEGETRIHHWYGLNSGPKHQRLDDCQDEIETLLGEYVTICDDASGNSFLIKMEGESRGSVYFLDHEIEIAESALKKVAKSFNEFVNNLKSEEESMDEFKARDPAGYDEFQRRLAELKRIYDEKYEAERKKD